MPIDVIPSLYNPNHLVLDSIRFTTSLYGVLDFPPPNTPGMQEEFGVELIALQHGSVVVEPKLGRDLQTKKAPGKDKHKVIDRGLKRAEIKITMTAWTQLGLDRMQYILEAAELRHRLKERKAMVAYHPYMSVHGINEIVVNEAVGPHKSELHGGHVLEFSCIEWKPEAQRRNRAQTVRTSAAPNGVQDSFGGGVVNRSVAPSANNINFTPNTDPGVNFTPG